MTARNLAQTIAAIRARRAFLRGTGNRIRRGRMPRQVYPRTIEQSYFVRLRAMLNLAERILLDELTPALPGILQEAALERADSERRLDDWSDRLGGLMRRARESFSRAYPDEKARDVADDIAKQTNGYQRQQLQTQLKDVVGVNVFGAEPNLVPRAKAFVAENVALIKSLPERTFAEIEQRVMSGVRSGQRVEDLRDDLRERFDVSERRATLIARDQVGKFYSELNNVRQQALGIDGYVWRTAQDERVRDAHVIREGKRYRWDSPPYDGHPGEPVQCRCWPDPDIEGLLDALEASEDDIEE